MVQCCLARGLKLIQGALLDGAQALVQVLDNFVRQFLFVHNDIPLSFNNAARA
jgi:hypothetical protein